MSQKVKMDQIKSNPNQVRQVKPTEPISELAQSISALGLRFPILIRPKNGDYEIVCGHRRYEACESLSWTEIDADIQQLTDDEAFLIGVMENVARANLAPIDEARAYKELQDKGMIQADIAKSVGKDRSYVAQKLRLLTLPRGVQLLLRRDVKKGGLLEGHARQLLRIPAMLEKYDLAPAEDALLHCSENGWVSHFQDWLAYHRGRINTRTEFPITVAEMEALVDNLRYDLYYASEMSPETYKWNKEEMDKWWDKWDKRVEEAQSKVKPGESIVTDKRDDRAVYVDGEIPACNFVMYLHDYVKPKIKKEYGADEGIWFIREMLKRSPLPEDEDEDYEYEDDEEDCVT